MPEGEKAKVLLEEVKKLPGILEIAPCLIRDLRLAGILHVDISSIDISTIGSVVDAFKRMGLVPMNAGESDVKRKAREIAERYGVSPMFLDSGAFLLGNMYCKEKLCDLCPIGHVCPKVDMR